MLLSLRAQRRRDIVDMVLGMHRHALSIVPTCLERELGFLQIDELIVYGSTLCLHRK